MTFISPKNGQIRISSECWRLLITHTERTNAETPRVALEGLIVATLSEASNVENAIKRESKIQVLKAQLKSTEREHSALAFKSEVLTSEIELVENNKRDLERAMSELSPPAS